MVLVDNILPRFGVLFPYVELTFFYKNNFEWQRSISIGNIYLILGDNEKGREQYEKSLASARAVKNQNMIRLSLYFIGKTYEQQEKWQEAFDYYGQVLKIGRLLPSKSDLAGDLLDVTLVNIQLKRWPDALQSASEALLIYQSLGADKNNLFVGYAGALNMLARAQDGIGNRRLAIFYEKQAVNAIQRERQQLKNLDQQAQRGYLKKNEKPYHRLADWLIAEGRLPEAEQVLRMLKEEEYFDYVRRDADEIKKLAQRLEPSSPERAALEKYEMLAGKVAEYGTQFAKLEELKNKQGADFKQQAEYDDLKAKLDAANAAFRVFLDKELVAELGKPVKKEIETDRALQGRLQQWGNGTVTLYTVVGEDRYRVILTTPKTQTDGKTEYKEVKLPNGERLENVGDLNKKIFEFRAALQNPAVDPRPLGKQLYDILIKPIEKDLLAAEAKTLVWSLDGTLRYIPLAALSPDGVHYLAEKYQTVVVTSTTRQSLVAETNPNWRLLGAGVTKESHLTEPNGTQELTFSALPGVSSELSQIVNSEDAQTKENGLIKGKRLIDENFNLAAFENGMSQRTANNKPKYNVIHLATHFYLGGNTAKSFLLLGGNQALSLDKVSDDTALNFGDVELVTLSACNTGFGTAVENKTDGREQENKRLEQNNGAEVDSLATFIELRGAKAVLASLWSVADESTQLLMSEFYRLRKARPRLTKAAALQLAQQEMIEGTLQPSAAANPQRGLRDAMTNAAYDPKRPYAHPYYWSPFILIGNWR